MLFKKFLKHLAAGFLSALLLPVLLNAPLATAGIAAQFSTAEETAPPIQTDVSLPMMENAEPLASCGDITITHSSSQTITVGNSVRCNNGVGQHVDNSYWRAFDLASLGVLVDLNVCEVQIGIEAATSSGGTQPVSVRLYTSSQTFPTGYPGSLTLIGSTDNYTVPDQSRTIFSIPVDGTALAGSELIVEILTPDGTAAGNSFRTGSNAASETGPSYLSAADCAIAIPTTTAAIGYPNMHIVMNVVGYTGFAGTLTGTVRNADTLAPLAGAKVRIGGRPLTTAADGTYLAYLEPRTYDNMTVAAFGFDNGTAANIVIVDNETTVQDFNLTPKGAVTVSGLVIDGSSAGWPLYASLKITTPGFSTTITSDPATGQYSVQLLENTAYTFTVSSSGYITQTVPIATGTGVLTRIFSLLASGDCTALGYYPNSSPVTLLDTFDGATPPGLPAGWAVVDVNGTAGNWATHAGTVHPSGQPSYSVPNLVYFNSYSASSGNKTRLYRTAGIDLSAESAAALSFWMYHDTGYTSLKDRVQVQVSTDGGSVWDNTSATIFRYDGSTGWKRHTADLTPYTGPGKTDVRVAFLGISAYGNDIHIDDVGLVYNPCSFTAGGGLVAGTVTDAATGLPMNGVKVKGGTTSAVTNTAGVYALFLPAGTYDISATTAGGSGYDNVTQNVTIVEGGTTEANFSLSKAPLITVSGTVTDGAGYGWPLYAHLYITAAGFSTTVLTDPLTGQYTVGLAGNITYSFKVSATGYVPQTVVFTTGTGPMIRDFALLLDNDTCAAPGYTPSGGFTSSFDGSTPPSLPAGWAVAVVNPGSSGTAPNWLTNAGTHDPASQAAHSSANLIYFNSYHATAGKSARLYRTEGVDLSSASSTILSFWMYHDTGYTSLKDRVQVQVSTDGGSVWDNASAAIARYDGSTGWKQQTVDLAAYIGQADVRVAFLGSSEYGNDIHIDDMVLSIDGVAGCEPIGAGGLVAGVVYDANTGHALSDVTVSIGASSSATDEAGMYILFAPAGSQSITATPLVGSGYDNATQNVNVVLGATVLADFSLAAGLLGVNPDSLTIDITAGTTDTRTITLGNTGGFNAGFELLEQLTSGTAATPAATSWDNGTAMPGTGRAHAGSATDEACRKIYVFGGENGTSVLSDVMYYDPAADNWTTDLSPIPHAGYTWQAVRIGGQFYLPGGYNGSYNNWLQIYNAAGDSWSAGAALPAATAPMAAAAYGKLYIFGGPGQADAVAMYDPITDRWATGLADMPTGRYWGSAIGVNNYIYVVGGDNGTSVTGAFERYDPATDNWTAGPSLGTPREAMSLFAAGGYLYAVGGDNRILYLPAVERYNLADFPGGTWDNMTSAPAAFGWAAYGCAGGKMRSIGGFNEAGGLVVVNRAMDAGLTCTCGVPDVAWLSQSPAKGSVASHSSQTVNVTFNSTGLSLGTYTANLRILNDTPYGILTVPVTMNVIAPTTTTTTTPATTTIPAACTDNDGDGYGDNCTAGADCDDDNPAVHDNCSECTVRIIPKVLGRLIGEKERTRLLIAIGKRGTEFDANTAVVWDTDGITTLRTRVFLKRFMLIKVRIDGAKLEKGEYKLTVGGCTGTISMVR